MAEFEEAKAVSQSLIVLSYVFYLTFCNLVVDYTIQITCN